MTRAKSPVQLLIGNPDSPRFSYVEYTLFECCDLSKTATLSLMQFTSYLTVKFANDSLKFFYTELKVVLRI
ncbi:hypothetical protein C4X99_07175 [Leptospira interrogans serovar Geyaweera]|nr:hypothetical protein C4X99_07175 [Leptospira interrogans serovar Geyaweera]